MSKERRADRPAPEAGGAQAAAGTIGKATRVGDEAQAAGPYKGSVFGAAAPPRDGNLPDELRTKFEGSLGVDLGGVRVHTDAGAAASASGVGARAYAKGQDIYFAENAYDPATADGQHLLAHEVAHTVQQSGGDARVQQKSAAGTMTSVGDRFEAEADHAADAMVTGRSFSVGEQSGPMIARQSSGEEAFLDALAMVGVSPNEGMVNLQTGKVKAHFPRGAHDLIRPPLNAFMHLRLGNPGAARVFRAWVNELLKKGWIGPPCRRQALGIGEDNEHVAEQVAEGKAPAKVAMKRAVEKKKDAAALDSAPQRSNAKVLKRALEKVAQSPFPSTAEFEGDHMRLQGPSADSLRKVVKILLGKFADAVEKKDAKLFSRTLLRNLTVLIGKNGVDDVYARGKALIARTALGKTREPGDGTTTMEKGFELNKDLAIKILEKAKSIPKVGPAFDFLANALKLTKDTEAAEIVGDITGLSSAVFNAVKTIVELAGANKDLGRQAAEQLSTVTKYLGFVGSAASAGKHLAAVFSANDARTRTEAIVALLGCVPGPIGDGIKISFAALRWLGEEGNKVRVASRDIALKEFFFGNAPIPAEDVPALLKAKVRLIRDLPVDASSARRTFGYLDLDPADPTGRGADLFPGLEARRAWAKVARPLHDKYAAGAFTIDGKMDWKSRPGNRTIDEYRVEAANAMKRAAANFVENKMRELTKQTGATDLPKD